MTSYSSVVNNDIKQPWHEVSAGKCMWRSTVIPQRYSLATTQ